MHCAHATAGAQRQAGQMAVLRGIKGNIEGRHTERRIRVAQGHVSHAQAYGEVAVQQHG